LSQILPPLLALRVCSAIYPRDDAYRDERQFSRRSVSGSTFNGSTRDFHEYPFAMHGFFDWRNIVVASTLCRQGDVIVEVGANIGTETISFLDIVGPRGEVLALEPDPNLIERLLRNLSDADTTALKPLNVAAGDTPGRMAFHSTSDSTSSGTGRLVFGTEPAPGADLIEVEVVRLVRREEEEAARGAARDSASGEEAIAQEVVFAARAEVRKVHVAEAIDRYFVDLVNGTRSPEKYGGDLAAWIQVGASPRGAIGLDRCSRVHAWLHQRDHVTPDDVRAVVHNVLRHRLQLSYEAGAAGISADRVVAELVRVVAVA